MIRILALLGLVAVFSADVLCAGAPAMVEKHIFTPENVVSSTNEEAGPAAPVTAGASLEKELSFTGVLITPRGKQAIISENIKNEPKKQKHVLKEGDQIKGMTIREIGPNYVLLAARESSMRLNLYKGAKPRPAPVADTVKADIPNQLAQQGVPKADVNNNVPVPDPPQGESKEKEMPVSVSPFGGGPKPGEPVVQQKPSAAPNPFTEILNKNRSSNPGHRGDAQLPLP